MPNTLDWNPGEKVRAVVFGRSGAGKTWGALTFPRPNVIDFDHGIAVSRNPEFVKAHGLRSIEYEQFTERNTSPAGIAKTHNSFDDACRYFDLWMDKDHVDRFDTWVLDSGTTMSNAAMNKAVILLGSPEFSKMSKTHEQALKTGLLFPKIQDYGSERSLVEQFIQMLLDSGKHVVVIAHEKEILNDAGTAVLSRVPLFTGKSSEVISLMFDNVWHLRVQGRDATQQRILTTKFDGITTAKSRYGMPDGTKWDWQSISTALEAIRKEQQNAKQALTDQAQAAGTPFVVGR